MVVGVAEQQLDGGQPLEAVADLVLRGEPDRAVQLHRLLPDEAASLTQLQQAYEASSRVFTLVNQLMDDLMNTVGQLR